MELPKKFQQIDKCSNYHAYDHTMLVINFVDNRGESDRSK